MPATTAGPARMFPWQTKSAPFSPPAQSRHLLPVQLATPPCASAIPSWRESQTESVAASARSTSGALSPDFNKTSALSPNEGSTRAWVAIAPTPASAQGTSVPTLKYFDCTATPSSFVTESNATIENVPRSFDASTGGAARARAREAQATAASAASEARTPGTVAPALGPRLAPLRHHPGAGRAPLEHGALHAVRLHEDLGAPQVRPEERPDLGPLALPSPPQQFPGPRDSRRRDHRREQVRGALEG